MTETCLFLSAVLAVAEMAAADRAAIAAGTPGIELMQKAGEAVAAAVTGRAGSRARILVLCGPGNNGGDGFVCARILTEQGHLVSLALAGEPGALHGDAAWAAAGWTGPVLKIAQAVPEEADIIVDALFGAGLSRPLDGEVAALVERVNAAKRFVIAVDVPSGVSGDSGQVEGPAIRASCTVTFFRLKPAHLLYPGRALCGPVTVADIGIDPAIAFAAGGIAPSMFCNGPGLWRRNWPDHQAQEHKYRRGSVVVAAGGLTGVGAPRLGARAALRIGAGLASIVCRPEALAAHAGRGPDALMQVAAQDGAGFAAEARRRKAAAVLIGPALGLDEQAREWVMAALGGDWPLVLDADALTHLAAMQEQGFARIHARRAACVLTPHEGEFARLIGTEGEFSPRRSKCERARSAARAAGAVIVLKGADSVIASPDGRATINTSGSPSLATAGSGDVLGGMIAGLLAQGMPAFEAACAGVWLHGRAGERLGLGLIADDLPEALPSLIRCCGDRAR